MNAKCGAHFRFLSRGGSGGSISLQRQRLQPVIHGLYRIYIVTTITTVVIQVELSLYNL